MKNAWLYVFGLMLLGIIALGASPAGAKNGPNGANGTGPYYVMPSWDQTLPADKRFIILTNMSNAAVLDQETGLVWEQAPTINNGVLFGAQEHCNALTTGNRRGWRLPALQELLSLVDPSVVFPGPVLPSGHPFSNVQGTYWSATADAGNASNVWGVDFDNGFMITGNKSDGSFTPGAWCVRGGRGQDSQY